MKIVIATGIYPPDIGGPAYYAKGLEDALRALGHEVKTVVYGDLRTWPMGVSHAMYLLRIWPHLRGADAVIALDTASVAIPAWLASRMRGVWFIIRTGGDFVWEHYIERTRNLVPLRFFYDEISDLSAKERLVYALTRLIVRRSVLVFSTDMQRDVWLRPYGLKKERTHVIGNEIDAPLAATAPAQKNFLWYVRPIAMKNGAHVRAAFARAKERHPDIVLEEGMVPKEKLLERMKGCYAVILPSVTEISPNYILDALRFKKPFILDKYSGYAKWLAPYGLLVDPLDEDDIARAIGELADGSGYARAVAKAAEFSFTRTYEEVARDFLALVSRPVSSVLMVGGDRRTLERGSAAWERAELQRSAVERLDIYVWPHVHSWFDIVSAARRVRYDAVTVQDPFWRGLLGWVAARLCGARFNVQVHTDLSAHAGIRRTLARFVLNRADSVRVVSEPLRRQVKEMGVSAVTTVVPVFVDVKKFSSLKRQSHIGKRILWIGRFEDEKDPLRALEVFRAVRASVQDATLVMLGDGSLRARVEREVAGAPVELVGWQDTATYLQTADAVLSTSRHESWGQSMIEALAAGVPVVAPDVGIAREAGAVVVPRDRLPEAVVQVLGSGKDATLRLHLPDSRTWAQRWRESL